MPATKATEKEDRKIECWRGGENQPMMTNSGDKANSKGYPIETTRVNQLYDDEG